MEEKTEIENVVNLDENIDNIESNNNNDNNDKSKDENKKKNKKSFKEFFKKYSIMNYIAIGIALYFLTVLLIGQFKTVSYSEEIVQGKRETQLSEELINLKSKYDELEQNYKKAQTIVEEYQNFNKGETQKENLKLEIDKQCENIFELSKLVNIEFDEILKENLNKINSRYNEKGEKRDNEQEK